MNETRRLRQRRKRIQAPFDHPEFVFELKMDGWLPAGTLFVFTNGEPMSLFEEATERTPSKDGQDGWIVCSVCAELEEEPLMANTTLLCGNCADRVMAEQDFVR